MQDEWIIVHPDGRHVKFTYQELVDHMAFLTAQVEGNEVVYSIVLSKVTKPLNRNEVENRFKGELEKSEQSRSQATINA